MLHHSQTCSLLPVCFPVILTGKVSPFFLFPFCRFVQNSVFPQAKLGYVVVCVCPLSVLNVCCACYRCVSCVLCVTLCVVHRLPYSEFFGGVSGLTVEQFRKINGFPNAFWGWGGEDDDLWNRLVSLSVGCVFERDTCII